MNEELFAKGLTTRREVLGSEYVDASIKNADDFTIELQQLVTQYGAMCGIVQPWIAKFAASSTWRYCLPSTVRTRSSSTFAGPSTTA